MVGQCGTAGEAVQRVENPQALARVGRDIDHANGLAGTGTLPNSAILSARLNSPVLRTRIRQVATSRAPPVRVAQFFPVPLPNI